MRTTAGRRIVVLGAALVALLALVVVQVADHALTRGSGTCH
ncbi:MAG: hypothetical protein ABW033_02990 [Acidimicrobiia bacterium]